jgi:general secretion pathway protein D
MSWSKKSLIIVSVAAFVSCSIPPKKPVTPPLSAYDLAASVPEVLPTAQPPIVELSQTKSAPPKDPSHVGKLVDVPTVTSRSPGDLKAMANEQPIVLNFEQTDLRQIIDLVGDALGLTMVVDPSIADKVTIRTPPDKKLTKKDLWPLLQLLLVDAGVSMEKKGDVYHFKKTGPSLLPNTVGSITGLEGSDAPEVLQIVPLRFISADSALQILTPLLQPTGRVISLPNVNVIGIIASPQRLQRVNQLLAVFDADPFTHRGIRLFRLKNAKATEVQQELEKVLQALSGTTAPSAYSVIGLERTNAVLVVAPPGGSFDEVSMWVDILDERSDEGKEQVFIYRVRNLKSKDIAATLTSVFKSEEKKDEKRVNEPTPLQPKPPILPNQVVPPTPNVNNNRTEGTGTSADIKVGIVADEPTNSLVIRATPRDYRQLLDTIYLLDQVPKEVMVNVVIAEVQLTDATKFGIDWQVLLDNNHGYVGTNFNVPTGSIIPQSTSTTTTTTGGTTTTNNNNSGNATITGFVANYVSSGLTALLNMISSTNDVNVLSRPSILVRNNEEASINVGAEEPFLSGIDVSSVNNYQTSRNVQYKKTGVILKVTPHINDDGVINMKIEQEVAQPGPTRTTENLQSFTTRRIETSVVVRDKTAIVIGGLIETRNSNDKQGITGLQDIPVVGDTLFSSTDKQKTRTELVLIIVPTIVSSKADDTALVQSFRSRQREIARLLDEEQADPKTYDPLLNHVLPKRPVPLVPRPITPVPSPQPLKPLRQK